MDTQKFLGLLEEVLAREPNDMPSLLSRILIWNSENRSITNSDRDTAHRLLPSARVTHNTLAIDTLRPGLLTPTISCHTGLHPCTKALGTLACPSKIPISPAIIALHATRRGAASQTCCIPSHHCYCGDRFGEWGMAGFH